jgi:hypothetical protein
LEKIEENGNVEFSSYNYVGIYFCSIIEDLKKNPIRLQRQPLWSLLKGGRCMKDALYNAN